MGKVAIVSSRWTIGAIIALGFVVSPILSDHAAARPFEAAFSVNAGDGYRISVAGWRDSVRVIVTQGLVRIGRHVIETEYAGRGTASPTGIEADLGSLGSISMRFDPTGRGRTRRLPKNCAPHKIYRRPGTFSGSFRFLGEASYAAFEAAEVEGSIGTPSDIICATFSPIKGRAPALPYLVARTSNHYMADGFLAFAASRTVDDPHHVDFTAELDEHVEGLSVRRFVTETSPASNFVVGAHLRRATVAPPEPFSGSATFLRRDADPQSWSGSLMVSFLGKSDVPLTGPNFRFVALSRSSF